MCMWVLHKGTDQEGVCVCRMIVQDLQDVFTLMGDAAVGVYVGVT